LADAVGSVREVVTPTLRELGTERLLETAPDEVVLLDPIALADHAAGGSGTTRRARGPRPPCGGAKDRGRHLDVRNAGDTSGGGTELDGARKNVRR
jgi:hypothetical protein